jgi:hypothetical protein
MKNLKQIILVAISAMIVFSSCTMEKRLYSSGYNVNWLKAKPKTQKVSAEENLATTNVVESISITASNGDDLYLPKESNKVTLDLYPSKTVVKSNSNTSAKESAKLKLADKVIKKAIKKSISKNNALAEEGKIEPIGLAGFIAFAISVIMSALSIVPVLGGVLGLASLILSLISIKKHTREMGKHSGAVFPLIVLWTQTIAFYLTALAFLILALIGSAFFGGLGFAFFIIFTLIFALLATLILLQILKYNKAKNG